MRRHPQNLLHRNPLSSRCTHRWRVLTHSAKNPALMSKNSSTYYELITRKRQRALGALWHGRGAQSGVCETRDHCFEAVSAVEPVFKPGEISRHVFGVHSPVGCGQSRLDVSRDGVEPFEGRLFGGLRAATRLNLSVRASGRCDGGEQAGASDNEQPSSFLKTRTGVDLPAFAAPGSLARNFSATPVARTQGFDRARTL